MPSFHVDHAASLPYVLAKTNFAGRVFMTHPTKAIYKWLIQDTVRVGSTSSSDTRTQLYTEADHFATFPRIEAIDYYTTHTISSIRITPYPAGHVLGAAMFLIEIAGLKILFTGDYSREEDRHLISAKVPKDTKIDVLITESTYGIASHIPRPEREAALLKSITGILHRGGKVLMPVFALGRAQELLLVLDEYWGQHPELQRVPIYYASSLARKCMSIYQAYVGAMNDNIRRLFQERMAEAERARALPGGGGGSDGGRGGSAAVVGGPWDFRYVRSLKGLDRFDDSGACVVLASPGMLQNGVSRELLERWAPSERNGVVITGYSVEGTMAKEILKEPDSIPVVTGQRGAPQGQAAWRGGRVREEERAMVPRRCSVQEFSFAAHVDGHENRDFIEEVAAPVVVGVHSMRCPLRAERDEADADWVQILVHGEKHNMMRLKSKLLSLNNEKTQKARIYSPANAEELRIPFRVDKSAKVVGRLAQAAPPPLSRGPSERDEGAQLVQGVLVQRDFKLSLMDPADLREYAGLTTTTVRCRQRLTLHLATTELIRWCLQGTFGSIEELGAAKKSKEEGREANGDVEMDSAVKEEIDGKIDRREATTFLVMGCVQVICEPNGCVTVEWEGNVLNDGIADAVMAVLFSVETSPASVMRESGYIHSTLASANMRPRFLEAALARPRFQRSEEPTRQHLTPRAPRAAPHVPRGAVRPRHHAHRAPKAPTDPFSRAQEAH